MGWFNRFKRKPDASRQVMLEVLLSGWRGLLKENFEIMPKGPVGIWANEEGDPVIGESIWRFWPDGRGEYQIYGLFGVADENIVHFEWKSAGEWLMHVLVHDEHYNPEEQWRTVGFRCFLTDDRVPSLIMVDCSPEGTLMESFGEWRPMAFPEGPVVWRGVVDLESDR